MPIFNVTIFFKSGLSHTVQMSQLNANSLETAWQKHLGDPASVEVLGFALENGGDMSLNPLDISGFVTEQV